MYKEDLYVATFSSRRWFVTLCGDMVSNYESHKNTEYIRNEVTRNGIIVINKEVMLKFNFESEFYSFLQELVASGVPFSSFSKDCGCAYDNVLSLINSGIITGRAIKL
jgi:hypothetical protein